jgi:hypothetical protein
VRLIQAHADVVNLFAAIGCFEMRKDHVVPSRP